MMEKTEHLGRSMNDCWNLSGVWGAKDCPELDSVLHCTNCKVYSRAGRLLLDRKPSERYRKEWTELLAAKKEEQKEGEVSLFLFRIGGEWFGLATVCFLEVLEPRPIHYLPHRSGPVLKGLVNVRGELQLCVSMAALLEIGPGGEDHDEDPEKTTGRMLFVQRDGENLVFPVTEVYGTHRYHPDELREAPATLAKTESNYTQGVLKWADGHVSVLEEGLLFDRIARGLK